ncbi:MAG: hypothetical protein KKA60_01340 [Proteobacteria bacterium]|nr:hypothetical protein [Pseudomonadota bacterium]
MSLGLRIFFFALLAVAMPLGYAHHVTPDHAEAFFRLHIFLFNLAGGGSLILWHSQGRGSLKPASAGFLALALAFSLLVFLGRMNAAAAFLAAGAVMVERVRTARFGFLPWAFFRRVSVADKFHLASLLCLSIGMVLCAAAMVNQATFHFPVPEKLTLNTFFLGFSFPLSLITMHLLFSLSRPLVRPFGRVLAQVLFWVLNLGVISFFVFILAEWTGAELFISLVLSAAVVGLLSLFATVGRLGQEKGLLLSGLIFLFLTAFTGVVYIVLALAGPYEDLSPLLLKTHAFLSLYGWNLSGLLVLTRKEDFPLAWPVLPLVGLHWLAVGFLAPAGDRVAGLAWAAVILYTLFLGAGLFLPQAGKRPREG